MPHRPPSLLTSPLRCPFSSTPVSSDHHRFLLPSQPQHRSPFPSNPFLSFTKHFSSQTLTSEYLSQLSQSLSSELLKPSDSDPFPLSQRLNLSFSHVSFSPPLILQTLNSSPAAGRAALDFLSWVSSKLPFSDEVCSFFVHYFGRRRDFKAIDEILARGKGVLGFRDSHKSGCFELAVSKLCDHGIAVFYYVEN